MSCIIDNHFRRNVDYQVKYLARYCGITRQAAYMILNSQRTPSVYTAIKMCDFFSHVNKELGKRKDSFSGKIKLHVDDLWIFDHMKIDDSS